ncbi:MULTISPECIES: 23S rRNA (guanosine(2251)-2'-O)-methyltransferase RlmB [Deefgea]|uniref:23S rRNA (guanosine-2'-O-)-methyltransferase RlmB n=1 Tax=Deefgea chitinilytica TaxID=570276 RepID=A0ABS2C9S2_9NEIS|nr:MULTISPECIES: 23S rRNA (guanosine(2251)-2'-O)-methyltransferase RlmB [Deefgea]MBM5570415.1 23S rRNA (guanosine(2251)-2'-O)-methyltransferase RlmB [Deefgea chitinilytica]MBM9887644.1 23S rRNA (guanosine(2251)-2'-O)-methyltransferase RlmB [Deefgea sp. CFH1-16]
MAQNKILHGFHAVGSRLRRFPDSVLEVYVNSERSDPRMKDLLKAVKMQDVKLIPVDGARLDGIAGHVRHQGVAALIDTEKSYLSIEDVLDDLDEPPFLLILDGITDPHNLGACLRVADAMGVHAVIAPKDKCVGITATVSKVACGAAEVVPYVMVTNLARTIRDLKERGIWVIGTAADGQSDLFHYEQTGPIAWVLGNEGEGMRRLTRELCDSLVSIPMYGSVESLNVSVAAGVVLSESRRQRVMKK